MKKIILTVTVFALFVMTILPITASAAGASASLTGPSTVRSGDTIILSFAVSGKGIYGAQGTLSYDSSQLTLSGTSQKIASPWVVEFNGKNFVAYDNNISSPINGNKTLFTVKFKVKSVKSGEKIEISYTNIQVSDGNADINVSNAVFSKNAAAPLSGNNKLESLTVSNAEISPSFSPDITSYTASVPFETSKLNCSATAADSKAKVSVNSPTLVPNATTKVTVTVRAENGSEKTYTVSVKRAQDPDYKPNSDNNLSDISVKGFVLSPKFTADNKDYIVWLPYETENVNVSATACDGKASVKVSGGDKLTAGSDNPVRIVCTAENGDKKEYSVILKRAAAHGDSSDRQTVTDSSETSASSENINGEISKSSVPVTPIIAVGIASLAIGAILGIFAEKTIAKRKTR